MAAVLIQIDGYDPVAGAAVALKAASVDDERVCHLNGALWWPALSKLPALRYDLFDGAFTARITTPESTLEMAVEPWANFARYLLADGRLRLWTGDAGDAWGAYTLRFDGRVKAQPGITNGVATVNFAVDDRWLDDPLLATYAGTTGIEGEAAQKGQPKPLAIGAPRYVPGQMIDSTNSIVQLSAYGAIEDVEQAMERLARFGASSGDYADFAALAAATIAPGYWASSKAYGLVRHGAPPTGQLSYHVKGDKAGPGGWVRLPGAVTKRIALLSGGSGKTDDASLTALDSARPYSVSIYQGTQTTARELIQKLAASVNAVAGVSWTGLLFVVPVQFGTPTLTLDATGAALPPVGKVEQIEIDAPYWKLAIEAEKTWQVHEAADVAFTATLIDRGRYDDGETYREGHMVDMADGSRWLYINPTPSAGNAPPSTGTSDSFWTQLTPATELSDIGYSGDADATRNDDGANMIPAPVDLSHAVVSGGATVAFDAGATGRPADRYQVSLSGAGAKAYWHDQPIPVQPGETLWYGHQAKTDISGGTDNCYAGFDCFGADGVQLAGGSGTVSLAGTTACTGTEAIGAFAAKATSFAVPAGVAAISPFVVRSGATTGAKFAVGEPYLGRTQQGADVTAESQVAITVITAISVPADYLGAIDADQLPIEFAPIVKRGDDDIRYSDSASYTITTTGLTATVDNANGSATKGLIEITAIAANTAFVELTVTVNGVAQPSVRITVSKELAPAPNPGGSGSKTASDSTLATITSGTSYMAVSDVMTVSLASGERLVGSAPVDYVVSGTDGAFRIVYGKWQYSPSGAGSWTDFGTAITGGAASAPSERGESATYGHGEFNQAKSGLSAGVFDVRLCCALSASGRNVSFLFSTATIEAKV